MYFFYKNETCTGCTSLMWVIMDNEPQKFVEQTQN